MEVRRQDSERCRKLNLGKEVREGVRKKQFDIAWRNYLYKARALFHAHCTFRRLLFNYVYKKFHHYTRKEEDVTDITYCAKKKSDT